ncbi:MAG: UbiA family prenyltransferase [Candidatus Methanomethylicia archaeon]
MQKILALIKIIRPLNSIMMGLGVCFSELIALKFFPPYYVMLNGFLSGFFLTASSMVINDIYDYEVDMINAPHRPIPSGYIKIWEAKIYCALLLFLGFLSASLINMYCFFIAIITFVISLAYNAYFKKVGLIGNFMVSFCVAIPFIFGAYAVGKSRELLSFFSLIAFLVNTGREIIKTISDVEGDVKRGIRSVAYVYGPKFASKLAVIFFVPALILIFIPVLYGWVSWLYLPIITISAIGLIGESLTILKMVNVEIAINVKKRILLYMLIALVAMFIGGYYG